MADTLTRDQILDTAEEVFRRFGPGKAAVVDVARALGVSHGTLYRHFSSKVALRDAVAERWLARVSTPLAGLAAQEGPAGPRLRRWLERLFAAKREVAERDPELFATYHQITTEARDVVGAHIDTLAVQVTGIVADGIRRGEFRAMEPETTARAVLHATTRFHNPVNAAAWADPHIDAQFAAVWALISRGLAAAAQESPAESTEGAR